MTFTGTIVDVTRAPKGEERGCRTELVAEVSNAEKLLENWGGGALGPSASDCYASLHRVAYYGDHTKTIRHLAGAKLPEGFTPNGHSLVSFLKGGRAPKRDYFYWELHERGNPIQAIHFGDYKAVKNGPAAPLELYNLAKDSGETIDLADQNPGLVEKAKILMTKARTRTPTGPSQSRKSRRFAFGQRM